MDNQVVALKDELSKGAVYAGLSTDVQNVVERLIDFVRVEQEGAAFDRSVFIEEMESLTPQEREGVMSAIIEFADNPDDINSYFYAEALSFWVSDELAEHSGKEQKPIYTDEFSVAVSKRDPLEILEKWSNSEFVDKQVLHNAALAEPFYYVSQYTYNLKDKIGLDVNDIPDQVFIGAFDELEEAGIYTSTLMELFGDREFFEDLFRHHWDGEYVSGKDVMYEKDFFAARPYGEEFLIRAARESPHIAASWSPKFVDLPFADNMFKAMLDEDPIMVLSMKDLSKIVAEKPYAGEYIQRAIDKDPLSVARFALLNTENPLAEKAYHDAREEFESFLQDNPNKSWRMVRIINDLHNESDDMRFGTVEGFSAQGLYDLLSSGRDHAYTSTFNGLLDRFLERSDTQNVGLSDMLKEDPERLKSLPEFLEGVASFSRVDDFLRAIGDEEQIDLVDTLFNEINHSSDNNQFVYSTATFVQSMLAGGHNIEYVETKIMEGYNNSDGFLKDQYGVLGAWLSNTAGHEISEDHAAFFKELEADERYQLPDLSQKDVSSLLDKDGRNYQLHIFYDDEDGHASYTHYKDFMRRDDWTLQEDEETGVALFQKKGNGREINAYVSMPHADGEAAEYIKYKAEEEGIHFSVVAHRGHSYHVDTSLDYMDDKAEIVFLGSCGGYQNVETVLESSENAHILSTSGTGSMYVNDPLLTWINSDILNEDKVQWSDIGQKISRMGNENASFYRTPPDNLALLFSKKFDEIQNEREMKSGLSNNFDHRAIGQDNVIADNDGQASEYHAALSSNSSAPV
ncbi:MAG: hypothetical protein ACRBDL_11180 [Alphaproteobacteria bacterium]